MKKYKKVIIILNLIVVSVYLVITVIRKEAILRDGELVLLELAPRDPRSLMQGDYMELRYKVATEIQKKQVAGNGFCAVVVDENRVAGNVRLLGDGELHADEVLIPYRVLNEWTVSIGAESYFFEEGQAEKYETAKYGGLKIDGQGHSVLVGLYDKEFNYIE